MSKKNRKQDKFVTSTGLEITIYQVDPMFLQKVINSVSKPPRPTYVTVTNTGRKEEFPLDEEAAKQTPHGMAVWELYVEKKAKADQEQNDRVMNALFYSGTNCVIPDDGWESKWTFLGVDVPTNPDERRAFYLSSELEAQDTVNLMTAILRMTGVDEEVLKQAEDAFRDTVRDGEQQ